MLLKYLILCVLVSSIQGAIYNLIGDEVLRLECTYADALLDSNDTIIQAEYGYKILITMKSVSINGGNGDFLLVKSGVIIDDGLTGRIFTYHINEEKEYISLTDNVLIHFEIFGAAGAYTGYVLTAQHYGEQVTTPAPTTTDVPWPTVSEEESAHITVNMTILSLDSITISIFENTVVQIATDYVAGTDLELAQAISVDNVQITTVVQCPIVWPNMETCFQITFALPLLLLEDSTHFGSYQLNRTHLYAMWENASNYFNGPYLEIYDLPDRSRVLTIWLSIIGSTSLLFGIVYLIAGYECSGYVLKKKQRELDLQNQRPSGDEKRSSLISLPPHPLQSIPPLFDSDMIYYDPDSSPFDANSSPPFLRSPGRGDLLDEREREGRKRFTFDAQNLEEHTET